MKFNAKNNEYHIEFKIIIEEYMLSEIKQLFLEYVNSLEINLDFQNFEAELKALPGKYGLPDGVLILALVDGNAAGCAALRSISQDTCEMKRLYVRNNYRGLGIGRSLINIIIQEALKLNYLYIRLDTLPTMKEAQDLYTSLGFYDIEPYVYNPIKGTRFMELKIKD